MKREAQLATGERYNISSRANQNVQKENATIIFQQGFTCDNQTVSRKIYIKPLDMFPFPYIAVGQSRC